MTEKAPADEVVIIGAGPAGLTAAYQLLKAGRTPTVLEADDMVGGISRTVERDGWRFDIGGHRFFTKVSAVEKFWHEVLPDEDFMLRPRKSRIFYQGKFYDYPLKAMNALTNLGVLEATRCVLSYVWARIRPPKDQDMYEGWLVARFGWRLYGHFFKTYTEKVWGHPASEMPADWAAQRVKNISLATAIVNALMPKRNQKEITSLIEEFQYPKLGPGMMWERCRDLLEAGGSKVVMRTWVTKIRHRNGQAVSVVADSEGGETEYPASAVISSMPLSALVHSMDPPAPAPVRKAAESLSYRDFLSVALVVPADKVRFDDNWIYIHDASVKTMRIQNFGSWSPYLVKHGRNVLGLEYTVLEGDESWNAPDEVLVERGKEELGRLGLIDPSAVETGYVVRMPKAYPYYDVDYHTNVETIRAWLEANAANVHPVGRNGMHRYNNADHSMYTAMLTVENLFGAHHDVWSVNVEEEYHEEGAAKSSGSPSGTGRDAPVLPKQAALRR
ncbi:MAG: NAD(P)/FAD-dependent oxidoreductase [Acidimicrobiales bacterium]